MQASVVLGDLKKPEDVKKLQQMIEELYDLFDPLYETTAPNGNIIAQRGKIAIYKNGAVYEKWINVDGGTTWSRIDADTPTVFTDRGDSSVLDFDEGDLTLDGTWRDLNLSSVVTAGAKAVLLRVKIKDGSTEQELSFREKGNSNAINVSAITTQVANIEIYADMIVACDTDRVIQYSGDVGTDTVDIAIRGWWN